MSEGVRRLTTDVGEPPKDGAPPHLNAESQQTGMLVRALQEALKESVGDLRREISEVKQHGRSDHRLVLGLFCGGFVAVCSLFGWGFTRLDDRAESNMTKLEDKLDGNFSKAGDKMTALGSTLVEIKTKLADLLERIPPIQTPPPHH